MVSIPPGVSAPTFVVTPTVVTPTLDRPVVYVSPSPELSPTEPADAAASVKK